MIFSIILALFINHQSLFINHVFAADSTPSADIKLKLEELKKEIASKAAKLKQEVNRKLKDKAYVGKVKSKSDTSFTLSASSDPKLVSFNQDTVFESQIKGKTRSTSSGQAKFSQKTISPEDYIAALGDVDETGVLTAKKVILLPQPKTSSPLTEKTYLWGQIISLSDKLITMKSKDFKNVAVSLPARSEVKLNDFIILTGSKNKNDIFEAGFVYVIPQGVVIKPKKVATPSAQTSSPSVKPKPKKSS